MAVIYLRSTDGNDADDGSTWALAKATLAAALTAAGAGGTVYVSQVHAETQASGMTLTSPGTASSRVKVFCVQDGGGTPAQPPTTLATSATVSTTSNTTIAFGAGYTYVYGITFSAGSGGAGTSGCNFTTAASWWRLESCTLRTLSTATGPISIGPSSATHNDIYVEWKNVTVQFAAVGQSILVSESLIWEGGSLANVTIPTSLFKGRTAGRGNIKVLGVDFSAAGSGKNIFDMSVANRTVLECTDCKLGSSVSLTTGTIVSPAGATAKFVNCDSGDTHTNYLYQDYFGTVEESLVVYRSSGASDGTDTFSRKMVSSAGTTYDSPLYSEWMYFWNETLGSVTVAFPIVTDNVTLTDGEAWIEVEYLWNSGFPFGSFATDKGGDVLTPGSTNQATDGTSSWTTTGLGTPVKQTLGTNVTPAEKGLIRARVCLAKASTTLYFDPKILSTASRCYMTEAGIANEGASSSGARSYTSGG